MGDERKILFVKEGCPHCRIVLDELYKIYRQQDIPADRRPEILDIKSEPSSRRIYEELIRKKHLENQAGTPTLLYDNVLILGFKSAGEFQAQLLTLMSGDFG